MHKKINNNNNKSVYTVFTIQIEYKNKINYKNGYLPTGVATLVSVALLDLCRLCVHSENTVEYSKKIHATKSLHHRIL